MLVQLFQAEVLDVLNETGTELGFSSWSLGSCDEVRTSQQRGSQLTIGAPSPLHVKCSLIPYIGEEGKYLPAFLDKTNTKGISVLNDHTVRFFFFNPLSTHYACVLTPIFHTKYAHKPPETCFSCFVVCVSKT